MHQELAKDQVYVTVDILILTVRGGKLELLLSRRTALPYEGRWALPGRFISPEESAEAAVKKLTDEMLPIPEHYSEQLYTFSALNRDPRGRVISVAYLVIVPGSRVDALMNGNGTPFHSFRLRSENGMPMLEGAEGETLRATDLAFDHGEIVRTGLQRLRGKIDYTEIGFRFLEDPEAVTLGELQTVFEAVLDTELDTSNFRRSILTRYERNGRIGQTERTKKPARGRPGVYYRVNGSGE